MPEGLNCSSVQEVSEGLWWAAVPGEPDGVPATLPTCSVSVAQDPEGAARVTLTQVTHFLELSPQPEQLAHAERNTFQGDCPTTHATVTVPERDPGP